jgi:hypothetical protein
MLVPSIYLDLILIDEFSEACRHCQEESVTLKAEIGVDIGGVKTASGLGNILKQQKLVRE